MNIQTSDMVELENLGHMQSFEWIRLEGTTSDTAMCGGCSPCDTDPNPCPD